MGFVVPSAAQGHLRTRYSVDLNTKYPTVVAVRLNAVIRPSSRDPQDFDDSKSDIYLFMF